MLISTSASLGIFQVRSTANLKFVSAAHIGIRIGFIDHCFNFSELLKAEVKTQSLKPSVMPKQCSLLQFIFLFFFLFLFLIRYVNFLGSLHTYSFEGGKEYVVPSLKMLQVTTNCNSTIVSWELPCCYNFHEFELRYTSNLCYFLA